MICPHCSNRNMVLRARSSISVPPYFAHPKNFGYCPSQENREGIYRGYGIQNPDPNNAKKLRDNFRHYWQYYFKKLKQLVPYLRKEEFTRLIDIASEERIWEYRNVEPYHIPYLLVTLADFPIQNQTLIINLRIAGSYTSVIGLIPISTIMKIFLAI